MSIAPVHGGQPVGPSHDEPARTTSPKEAQNTVSKHDGKVTEKPSDAPLMLLGGLIPIAGPFILLAGLIGKIAEFAGGGAKPAASGQPGKSPAQPNTGSVELARASAKKTIEANVEESGSFGDERTGGSGKVSASARAGARADAVVTAGPDGMRAAAGARAEVSAKVRAEGELHGEAGRAAGVAQAEVSAYAEVSGEACANPDGITARGQAIVGAEAKADALVCAESAPIVKLGDVEWKAGATASGYARSGSTASAEAEVTASFNPPEVVGTVGAKAFAGARAGANTTVGIGPFKLEAGIDARAGAGVEYGLDFGFKDGKLNLSGFAGIAAAIGLGSHFNLSIDFNEIGQAVAGIFGKVAADAPPGSPGQAAASAVSEFVKAATPLLAKSAESVSSFDLLGGEGKDREEITGDAKTFRSDDERSTKQRDADTEKAIARQQASTRRQLESVGNGGRSKLDSSLV